tara:strand:- start:57 stop:416 length:360 start_codon:yes stop_codon:yes gene_type:complete
MPDANADLDKQAVTLSDSAVKRLKELGTDEGHAGLMLRVAVDGGGCSGFQYSFSFESNIKDDDQLIEKDGITVIIDNVSWEYLAGSEIGYKQELIGAYFSIDNPNAASTCGCGTSFALM